MALHWRHQLIHSYKRISGFNETRKKFFTVDHGTDIINTNTQVVLSHTFKRCILLLMSQFLLY